MTFHVTSLFAALLGLMMVPLSLQVSLRRMGLKASYGDADDETLRRRIRAHGNFVEYVPMGLILLGLIEWNSAPALIVWSFGTAIVASRMLHAFGMLYAPTPLVQGTGMIIQHVAFLAGAAWLLFAFSA